MTTAGICIVAVRIFSYTQPIHWISNMALVRHTVIELYRKYDRAFLLYHVHNDRSIGLTLPEPYADVLLA